MTLNSGGRGQHHKYAPRAFTQEGVAMVSGEQRQQRKLVAQVFEYLRKLQDPPAKPKRPIGFRAGADGD